MSQNGERIWSLLSLSIIYIFVVTIIISIISSFLQFETLIQTLLTLLAIVPVLALLIYIFIMRIYQIPRSYNVALVGFPQSGKTTLIISLFGEAFARNLPIRMMPRGSRTIELVNESLEMLRRGEALGPTKDQDRFAFRADVTLKRFPLPATYKVEFGDFPGKSSEDYSEKYGDWLHTTEFFKWVADSDAIIFVVDIGKYLSNKQLRMNYISRITKAFRAAWQHYLDVNDHRTREVRRHPIVIAFNKADLIQRVPKAVDFDLMDPDTNMKIIENRIAKLGFGDKVPPIVEIDPVIIDRSREKVEEDFAELINYFRAEAPNTRVIFTSSFALLKNRRFGIKELFLSVFARAS